MLQTDNQAHTTIELLTPNGPEFRRVSTAPARRPNDDEIPIIDLKNIDGNLEARQNIATQVRKAAENTGFFYVQEHGIPEQLIQEALVLAKAFFEQPVETKALLSREYTGAAFVGYRGVSKNQINRTETRDNKETFGMVYDARYDPLHTGSLESTTGDDEATKSHDIAWQRTQHLSGFQDTTVSFWQHCIELARKLVRIFALALDLPENYFDSVTTHPGADALYIHYPPAPADSGSDIDVGIGSHTDIQLFTLLWQDKSGGLQVLANTDEWLDARPIDGTLVVNVGDFLQRLSNDRFRSTVHRVYNRTSRSRYSMPFFFGFDMDAVCEIVPTCVDDARPAKYEPISCGEWRRQRFALASKPRS